MVEIDGKLTPVTSSRLQEKCCYIRTENKRECIIKNKTSKAGMCTFCISSKRPIDFGLSCVQAICLRNPPSSAILHRAPQRDLRSVSDKQLFFYPGRQR